MDTLDAMEALARQARREPPPKTDVATQVLMRIRSEETFPIMPLSVFAVAAMTAAAAVVAIALYSWAALNDPLMEIFASFEMRIL